MLCGLLDNVAGPGRARLLAISELRCEAACKAVARTDARRRRGRRLHRLRGGPALLGYRVTPARAAAVTLALHAAIPHLQAGGPNTMTAAGVNDLGTFVRNLLDAIYGPSK